MGIVGTIRDADIATACRRTAEILRIGQVHAVIGTEGRIRDHRCRRARDLDTAGTATCDEAEQGDDAAAQQKGRTNTKVHQVLLIKVLARSWRSFERPGRIPRAPKQPSPAGTDCSSIVVGRVVALDWAVVNEGRRQNEGAYRCRETHRITNLTGAWEVLHSAWPKP